MSILINNEKIKYDSLHKKEIKYGGRTGRAKALKRASDDLHVEFKKAILNSKTLLDVGCGKGFFMEFFHNQYSHLKIVGMDISKEAVRFITKFPTHICSASDMSLFNDRMFDIVIHQDGMEHIPVELEKKAMNEIFRVSNKYIYMTIAIHEIKRDKGKVGNEKVHCNIKKAKCWIEIFHKFKQEKGIKKLLLSHDENWVYVFMEK